MSDPSPSPTENTGSPKKKVSPARNLIGLIALVAVLAVAGFQYAALIRYTVAVKALDARAVDDDKGLMTNQEADSLLGKAPDGPGSDFTEEGRNFTKKTYTWQGPLKSFTLTASTRTERPPSCTTSRRRARNTCPNGRRESDRPHQNLKRERAG